jgi:hypothetical protein
VNGEEKSKGTLLEDFTPSVNPPKEIDDTDDKKPSDWVDIQKIADPEARKVCVVVVFFTSNPELGLLA